jgi:hypothetical protein
MEYPHWIMVTGAVLVVLGFIGLIFHKNKNPEPAEDNLKQAAPEPIHAALESGDEGEGEMTAQYRDA